jgi:hypothetical protein
MILCNSKLIVPVIVFFVQHLCVQTVQELVAGACMKFCVHEEVKKVGGYWTAVSLHSLLYCLFWKHCYMGSCGILLSGVFRKKAVSGDLLQNSNMWFLKLWVTNRLPWVVTCSKGSLVVTLYKSGRSYVALWSHSIMKFENSCSHV